MCDRYSAVRWLLRLHPFHYEVYRPIGCEKGAIVYFDLHVFGTF